MMIADNFKNLEDLQFPVAFVGPHKSFRTTLALYTILVDALRNNKSGTIVVVSKSVVTEAHIKTLISSAMGMSYNEVSGLINVAGVTWAIFSSVEQLLQSSITDTRYFLYDEVNDFRYLVKNGDPFLSIPGISVVYCAGTLSVINPSGVDKIVAASARFVECSTGHRNDPPSARVINFTKELRYDRSAFETP